MKQNLFYLNTIEKKYLSIFESRRMKHLITFPHTVYDLKYSKVIPQIYFNKFSCILGLALYGKAKKRKNNYIIYFLFDFESFIFEK